MSASYSRHFQLYRNSIGQSEKLFRVTFLYKFITMNEENIAIGKLSLD